MISVTATHNIDSLNAALVDYARASGKTGDEVLEQKGRDLGIQLFREFQNRKWGGSARGGGRNLAFGELKARTAEGRGTRVRKSLLKTYAAQRGTLLAQARNIRNSIGPQNAATTRAKDRALVRNQKARINLWQRVVGREVSLRAKGIGVLGASFLWFRRRSSQARGTFYVRNKAGRSLGHVDRGKDYFRILTDFRASDGDTPHGLISDRYGIVDRAVETVRADTEVYLRRKQRELFLFTFSRVRGAA